MNNAERLKWAISNKQPVVIQYKNKGRDILPFLLGRTKDDRIVLQAFQRGDGGGWRFFYLNEMVENTVITGSGFFDAKIWDDATSTIKKSEDGSYTAPAFVAEVLALVKL